TTTLASDAGAAGWALQARSAVLHSVIAAARATDAAGDAVDPETAIGRILDLLSDLRRRNGSLYIVGNGGSAATASHGVPAFLHVGGLRAMTVHDSSLLTCMG